MLCEPLESRRHLSISLFVGNLIVGGTEGANTMSVTQNGSYVTASDGSTSQQFFESQVHSVYVDGWGGADTITIGNDLSTTKWVWVSGGEGNDTIHGGGGQSPNLAGDGGDDTLYAGPAPYTTVSGGDGADVLIGAFAGYAPLLQGQGGNDTLYGTPSQHARLSGGDGNDLIYGAHGYGQMLQGDAGNDTLYAGATESNLSGGDDQDSLHGSAFNDYLSGDAGNDYVWGEGSNDTLLGEGGSDSLYDGPGNDSVEGGDGDDYYNGMGEGTDTVLGGRGNDRFDAGVRADWAQNPAVDHLDVWRGGDGTDLVSHTYFLGGASRTQDSKFEMNDGLHNDGAAYIIAADGHVGERDKYEEMEQVLAGSGNDLIRWDGFDGNPADFTYDNVAVYGEGGNDTISGAWGNDWLSGGQGNDLINGANIAGTRDVVEGGDGNDVLNISLGVNEFHGGSGNDTASFSGVGGAVRVTANDDLNNDGRLINGVPDGSKIHSNVETLIGGAGNDYLRASDSGGRLIGNAGNDTLLDGNGDDVLDGGAGSDRLYSDFGTDVLTGGSGRDLFTLGLDSTATIFAQDGERDTIFGADGNDVLDVDWFDLIS